MNDLDFLKSVKQALLLHGWCQDKYFEPTGHMCVTGAGCLVEYGDPFPSIIDRARVANRLRRLLRLDCSPMCWNDLRVQTRHQVISRIDDAIERHEPKVEETEVEETHDERELVPV